MVTTSPDVSGVEGREEGGAHGLQVELLVSGFDFNGFEFRSTLRSYLKGS